MVRIDVALFNFEHGGMRGHGDWDFGKLKRALEVLDRPPALVFLCEAKEYGYWMRKGLYGAANALSRTFSGIPYQARLGYGSPYPPALFFDPNVLEIQGWGDDHVTVSESKRNVAHFLVRENGKEFLADVAHLDYRCGKKRLGEVLKFVSYSKNKLPYLLGGDKNGTASGPHLPVRDWSQASVEDRRQKGRKVKGEWVADTRAIDYLIGEWSNKKGRRKKGGGFYAICETAHATGTPAKEAFKPTVNDNIDAGGGLHIDWLLANEAMNRAYIPGSYKIYVPKGTKRSDYPSDHRLVVASFEL